MRILYTKVFYLHFTLMFIQINTQNIVRMFPLGICKNITILFVLIERNSNANEIRGYKHSAGKIELKTGKRMKR